MIYDKLLENIIQELEIMWHNVNKDIVIHFALRNLDIEELSNEIIAIKVLHKKTK